MSTLLHCEELYNWGHVHLTGNVHIAPLPRTIKLRTCAPDWQCPHCSIAKNCITEDMCTWLAMSTLLHCQELYNWGHVHLTGNVHIAPLPRTIKLRTCAPDWQCPHCSIAKNYITEDMCTWLAMSTLLHCEELYNWGHMHLTVALSTLLLCWELRTFAPDTGHRHIAS